MRRGGEARRRPGGQGREQAAGCLRAHLGNAGRAVDHQGLKIRQHRGLLHARQPAAALASFHCSPLSRALRDMVPRADGLMWWWSGVLGGAARGERVQEGAA